MKILITGVSGFLGRHLASALTASGHQVSGLGLADGVRTPGIAEEHVDILDRESLKAAIGRLAPDCIVHLAGMSHVGQSWSRIADYFAINVQGVENVVEVAGDRHVILASSSEVYGVVPEAEQPIAEDRPPAPANPYAVTKAAAELLVLGRGGTVLRMFNLVGAGQSTAFALPGWAQKLAGQRAAGPVTLEVGNLEARRDFVHVADAADAYRILLEADRRGGIYNLAGGKAVSIEKALHDLIAIAGMEVSIKVDPARLRPVDVPVVTGDASKLEGLGWQRRRGLIGGLEDLWKAACASSA